MLRALAPAKINLSLKVFPPEPDGYHPLDSIVQTVLGEELWAEPAKGKKDKLELIDQPPFPREALDVGPSNLVLRAVAALREAGAVIPPLHFRLAKAMPAAAGLGGGSGDAAAALVLAAAHADPSTVGDLMPVAASIGADVPVLLRGGTVRMRGRGEQLTHLPDAVDYGLFIWVPSFGLPTGGVYRRFDEMGFPRGPVIEDVPSCLSEYAPFRNDLTPAAESLDPRVAGHLDTLSSIFERPALMSGSGSAMFCFFESAEAAADAAQAVDRDLERLDPNARLIARVRPSRQGVRLYED